MKCLRRLDPTTHVNMIRWLPALVLLCVLVSHASAGVSSLHRRSAIIQRRHTNQLPQHNVQTSLLEEGSVAGSWSGADRSSSDSEEGSWLERLRRGRRRDVPRDANEHIAGLPVVNPEHLSEDEQEEEDDDDEVEALLRKRRLRTADDSGDDSGDSGDGEHRGGDGYVGHGGGDDDDDDDGGDDEGDGDNDGAPSRTPGERLVLQMLREASREGDSEVLEDAADDVPPTLSDVENVAQANAHLKSIWKRHVTRWDAEAVSAERAQARKFIQHPETSPVLGWPALFWNVLEAMSDPAGVPKDKAWIEASVVSQLKGTALLCHEPKLAKHASKLSRPPRGVRLVTPRATHQMQRAIAIALAASVGATHVFIDLDTIDAVRTEALQDGISEDMLSRQTLLSVLLDLAEEEGEPFVITLCDKGSVVLNSDATSEVILDEMNNPLSRVFFVLTSVTSNVTEAGVQTATSPSTATEQLSHSPPLHSPLDGMPTNGTARFRVGMPPPFGFSMPSPKMLRELLKRRQEQGAQKDKQNDNGPAKAAAPGPPEGQFGASQDGTESKDAPEASHVMSFPIIFSDPTGTNRFPIPMIPLPALLEATRALNPDALMRQRSQSQAGQPPAPTSADSLSALFEDVVVPPPQTPAIRASWEKVLMSDALNLIFQRNSKALENAMSLNNVSIRGGMQSIQRLLSWRVLTDEQVDAILLTALKVEASRNATGLVLTGNDEPTWEISPQSIEIAVRDVCGSAIPSAGQAPATRTKEQIDAMIQDKQERGLLANIISPQDIGVTYDMIGGLVDVKELLRQCVTYPLKYPHLYKEGIAAEAVKGVLLFGPPGTGKTMLAKAVATEGGATFLSIDASTIESKWLGESEKNARAMFTLARKLAPCVIYIDEVDSVLSSRERGDDSSHGTLTSLKTTIMQEWDGLRTTSDRVLVIASTNRPYDLDEAVLRRLPRRILVDLPDRDTRKAVLEVSMTGNRISPDVNFTMIADQLEGYSGSDIKEICREAVVRIAHEQAQKYENGTEEVNTTQVLRHITPGDFESAIQRLRASVNQEGRELSRVLEWNEKFGEIKKKKPRSQFSMYL